MLHFRTTRSGSTYSNYYTVQDPTFDLDALLRNAAADVEPYEEDPIGAEASGDWIDELENPCSSPLTSPPSSTPASRAPSLERHAGPGPSAPLQPRATIVGKKRGKKERSRLYRAKKRAREREQWGPPTQGAKIRRGAQRIIEAENEATQISWEDMPVTSTGYTGKRGEGESRTYSLDDLVGSNAKVPDMTYLDWDGRISKGITAPDGRVFAVLAGHPDDPSWPSVHTSLAEEIRACGEHVRFPVAASDHRRGRFGAQAYGVSHGGGQTAPANLKHTRTMEKALLHLLSLTSMVRIASFASSVFSTWAPLLFAYYAEHMGALFQNNPSLVRNFARSIWACVTINFGPRTVTFKHRDFGNLPFGWCAITALGQYNPDLGGHLVLWECRLVIRFPPGSTVLIPSAIIHHSNTRIARNERRYSVTQYTAGALFRWVDHGCKLDEIYYKSLTADGKARALAANARRWKEGVELWSTIGDLREAARRVVDASGR
ncbi:hypothetical protein HDZ31DRAFT_47158 [Schizophyllum fasciatum]